jgi:hypothetical protein
MTRRISLPHSEVLLVRPNSSATNKAAGGILPPSRSPPARPASTRLGDRLAATLPNIFGANAGSHNLTGKSFGGMRRRFSFPRSQDLAKMRLSPYWPGDSQK